MKKMKLKIAITGLGIVVLIGGTLAYFNQTLTAINPFDTGKYSTTLVETFKPVDGVNWEPGVEINKDVEVVNTGDQPVVVRVKFDETWSRTIEGTFKSIEAADVGYEPPHMAVYDVYQANATDGLVADDDTVVTKFFDADNIANWTLDTDDGWWYYHSTLDPAATTGLFLSSVQLISDLDIGFYEVENYWTSMTEMPAITSYDFTNLDPTTGWVLYDNTTEELDSSALHSISVTVLDETAMGYSDADYALTITVQTVQATNAAVDTIFGTGIPAAVTGSPTWILTDETL